MMHDIQMMMMGFDFYQGLDIPEARKLLVDAVDEYLAEINANDKVRPYLHNYPFTYQNTKEPIRQVKEVKIAPIWRIMVFHSSQQAGQVKVAIQHEKLCFHD